jgi:hypothetical protein
MITVIINKTLAQLEAFKAGVFDDGAFFLRRGLQFHLQEVFPLDKVFVWRSNRPPSYNEQYLFKVVLKNTEISELEVATVLIDVTSKWGNILGVYKKRVMKKVGV